MCVWMWDLGILYGKRTLESFSLSRALDFGCSLLSTAGMDVSSRS